MFGRKVFPVATTYRIPTLTSRRAYFRLPYPVSCRAELRVRGANYPVVEISERGLRVECPDAEAAALAGRVEGSLLLMTGGRCTVVGSVLRKESRFLILKLERGPSCHDVMTEQRFVAKTFPDWKP